MRRLARRVLVGLGIVAALGVVAVLWGRDAVERPGPLVSETTVVLPRGMGLDGIAHRLAEAGVIDRSWLRGHLAAAVNHLERPVQRITVTIVDDDRIRALNRTHRRWADTTDVLAFEHSREGEPVEADIVICADESS